MKVNLLAVGTQMSLYEREYGLQSAKGKQ